jgi:hypothetical protein
MLKRLQMMQHIVSSDISRVFLCGLVCNMQQELKFSYPGWLFLGHYTLAWYEPDDSAHCCPISFILILTLTLLLLPPLLLLQVAAATLKLALFVSSACSSFSYLLNGQLLLSYGLAFGIANLLTTPMGQWLMDICIAKTGRPSMIMVVAIAKNLAAIPLLVAFNGVPGVQDLLHHTNVAFHVDKLACA